MDKQYFAALNAVSRLPSNLLVPPTVVVIGCGPVGLCALVALSSLLSHTDARIFAVDSVPSRLSRAQETVGAIPLNFKEVDVAEEVKKATFDRGADIVLELVGLEAALKTAFEVVRPFGAISSVGVHNGKGGVGFTGAEGAYILPISLLTLFLPSFLDCVDRDL